MIKLIGPEEYVTVCSWWGKHGFPIVPPQSLPSTGYMAFNKDYDICAGYLYLMREGNFGWMEFLVSNPDATKEIKADAFKELIDVITEIAKGMGVEVLLTSCDRSKQKLIDRITSNGFFDGGESVAHLMKVIVKEQPCQHVVPQQPLQ